MYMVAQRAVKYPIKITTMQYHENLDNFIRQAHIDYINFCAELTSKLDDPKSGAWVKANLEKISFRSYLNTRASTRWFIHECVPTDKDPGTGKVKQPRDLSKYSYAEAADDCGLVDIARGLGYNLEE